MGSAWGQPISCPTCGGALTHVNGTSNGLLAITIVRCAPCRREYEITARLRPYARVA